MNKGIELLQGQKEEKAKEVRQARVAKASGFLIVILYCLVVGVVFSFSFYLQKQEENVNQEVAATKQKITDLKKVESQQLILKDRLKFLSDKMSESQFDFDKIIVFFEKLNTEGMTIDSLSFSGKDQVTAEGSVENALVLGQILDILQSPDGNPFGLVILNTVSKTEEIGYKFSLTLQTNGNI